MALATVYLDPDDPELRYDYLGPDRLAARPRSVADLERMVAQAKRSLSQCEQRLAVAIRFDQPDVGYYEDCVWRAHEHLTHLRARLADAVDYQQAKMRVS